ncbi:Sulfotransferase 4A1-like [Homarus americanus]|uniref:Sulfotransferase 4A1-like n=1 Tax=Homarus americanus TaxID=6706 RepID=A0A8J5N5U3_HOMAM|nr:Sulfotransferase 4A1-like [Homarus americanus]
MLQRLIPMLTTTGRPHGVERLYSVRQCVQKSSLAETQLRIGIGSHRLFSNSSTEDPTLRRFLLYKRLFAVSLFTGTLTFAWYMKKQKGSKLKDLLEGFTRLPIDESLFGCNVSMYRYKGYVFPGQIVMSGIFKELPNFQFKPEDVIVASYPKTGNLEKSDDSSEVLETRFPYLEYPYPGIKSIGAKTGPRYVKTHLPITLLPSSFENSNAKLIYIARNPRDTAVSYFYFLRLLTQCSYEGTLSSFIKMFLSDMAVYSPFFDHVLGYWKSREDPSILFITYEELHQDSIKVIKKIAEFLEVEVSQVGSWEVHLNKEEVAAFEEWENRHLKDSDLRFIFTLPAKQVEG